ncbi:MAG: hypothetical protein MJ090_04830 [Clostridia bacterium]|nr:hypothetical protein [Clostridia bacterium]
MKRSLKAFFSSFSLTAVIIGCIVFGGFFVAKSYETMVYTSFGIKKSAIERLDNGIRILDFEIYF